MQLKAEVKRIPDKEDKINLHAYHGQLIILTAASLTIEMLNQVHIWRELKSPTINHNKFLLIDHT